MISFLPTGQARQAQLYLSITRGVANSVHPNRLLGYAPGDFDGSCCLGLAKQIVARFGYHGLQTCIGLGIFKENEADGTLNLRLQYRVMFSCLDPADGRTAYYQGRTVEPHPSQYPKIGPSGISRVPFWIPISNPSIDGTIGVEAAMGVAVLAYYGIPSLATLGSGFHPHWLEYFEAPFFWAQDNDVQKPGRKKGEMVQAGEQQAQKCIKLCQEANLPACRLEPPRFSPHENGMDDWVHREGIDPAYEALEKIIGYSPIRQSAIMI